MPKMNIQILKILKKILKKKYLQKIIYMKIFMYIIFLEYIIIKIKYGKNMEKDLTRKYSWEILNFWIFQRYLRIF